MEKDLRDRDAKKQHLIVAVESINKEDYAGYLKNEIVNDYNRLEYY
jgi:hypothetical protein